MGWCKEIQEQDDLVRDKNVMLLLQTEGCCGFCGEDQRKQKPLVFSLSRKDAVIVCTSCKNMFSING